MTIYGEDQYLITNQLGRYNLGDRLLTYEDGAFVSNSMEKELQILIQAGNVRPPEQLGDELVACAEWRGVVHDDFSVLWGVGEYVEWELGVSYCYESCGSTWIIVYLPAFSS